MNTTTAPRQNYREQDDGLKRALLVSLGAHVLIFVVFFVRAVFYPSEPLLLDDAIRVDIVSLPDKGQQKNLPPPLEAPAPPAPTKPEPQPVEQPAAKPVEVTKPVAPVKPLPEAPAVNLKKTRKDQEAALKRLEALNKIESMVKSDASNTKVAPPQPVKGNEISHGSALKGIVRLEHDSYLRTIDTAVKRHWNLPGWLANATLSARVRLFVDAQGNVVKKAITRSSGNEDYDSRVMATVDAASPLPAPPSSLVNVLAVDGIELEFVPK